MLIVVVVVSGVPKWGGENGGIQTPNYSRYDSAELIKNARSCFSKDVALHCRECEERGPKIIFAPCD